MLKIVTFHAAFIPLQGLGSSLPSPCAGKVLAVMEAVLSLARWALCVTRSGVISPIHISNSLGLTPVLMQPVKQKYLTKQCSAGQVHSNRLGTLGTALEGCGKSHPPFPRDPFFSRTHPAHSGYLLALAHLHIRVCVLLTDPAALLLLSKPASVLTPRLGRASCQVSALTALALQGRLPWMGAGPW